MRKTPQLYAHSCVISQLLDSGSAQTVELNPSISRGMTLAIWRGLEKGSSHDDRTIFEINRWLLRAGHFAARLLSQSLLVFVYRLCSDQLDPVRFHELVPDDQFPSLARSKERRSAGFKKLGSVTLHAVA
jgi:hypothetical protein